MAEANIIELTADVVANYLANNSVEPSALPDLIRTVYGALHNIGLAPELAVAEKQTPMVPIRKSIAPDFLTCIECGQKQKSLKRHLMSAHDLTPEGYRSKWGLAKDYPMVAPDYAAARSALAKSMGLGQGGRKVEAPLPDPAAAKKTRAKAKAAAE